MKKYLFTIAFLIMVGSAIAGNSTNQQINPKNNLEVIITDGVDYWFEEEEVLWWFEDNLDRDGNIIGRAIVVKNNTSNDIVITFNITENGKKNTVSKYVPAGEQEMAYYGNKTLDVIGKAKHVKSPTNL